MSPHRCCARGSARQPRSRKAGGRRGQRQKHRSVACRGSPAIWNRRESERAPPRRCSWERWLHFTVEWRPLGRRRAEARRYTLQFASLGSEMIKFGTSGWRGIIGEDFTFENVRIASQGIANYLKKAKQKGSGMVVAYDTRFLSEKFALECARILAFNDIHAFLCTRDAPTPCVSFETVRRKAMGAINFTASHNPPEYNGLKFSTANGAPALPEFTKQIEKEIHAIEEKNEKIDVYEKRELIESIDPKDRYLTELRSKIDVDAIRKSGLRIAIDSLYGTSRDYLDYFLLEAGLEVKIIHNFRDPYFGGFSPECNEKNLIELRAVVSSEHFDLGLATDGDADRFGIVDDRNRFVSPNVILGLLALYLKRTRN